MKTKHIPRRPHVQGHTNPLFLRSGAADLTDGAGLLLLRRLWDTLDLGRWLDARTRSLPGRYRPSLMVEVWTALLFYGGGWMDDLGWFGRRGIRRLFGWKAVPDPTTFGRWLRRCGAVLVPLLDTLCWKLVRIRWRWTSVPKAVTLVVDSTVVVRYGAKQAGAEVGYNPKKRGRPSHHPIVAFLQETGDLVGIRWRPGSANTAAGAKTWIPELITRLREAGVQHITVRVDKGFFSKKLPQVLAKLNVHFFLKVPNQPWLRTYRGPWRQSKRAEGAFPQATEVWSATGTLWDFRLLALQGRRPVSTEEGTLDLNSYEVTETAHVLTNLTGIHALTGWRLYNAGAVVEHRIEELGQLSVGQTAVDDLDGNRLLWALGGGRSRLPTPPSAANHGPGPGLENGSTPASSSLALSHARPVPSSRTPVASHVQRSRRVGGRQPPATPATSSSALAFRCLTRSLSSSSHLQRPTREAEESHPATGTTCRSCGRSARGSQNASHRGPGSVRTNHRLLIFVHIPLTQDLGSRMPISLPWSGTAMPSPKGSVGRRSSRSTRRMDGPLNSAPANGTVQTRSCWKTRSISRRC